MELTEEAPRSTSMWVWVERGLREEVKLRSCRKSCSQEQEHNKCRHGGVRCPGLVGNLSSSAWLQQDSQKAWPRDFLMFSLFPVVDTAITDQAVAKFLKLAGTGIVLGFILLAFRKGLNYNLISSIIYLVPRDMPLKIHYRTLFTLKCLIL